jgi:hypothetical protein
VTHNNEQQVSEHAALLGRVTLVWNDCHYMVLLIYNTLSDEGWDKACTAFFDQNSDYNRRGITQTRIKNVLITKNDRDLRDRGTQLLETLDKLAKERNLATHTMWASVPIHTMLTVGTPKNEIKPHPAVPMPEKLDVDFESQFRNLTRELGNMRGDLELYEDALAVHLENKRARAREG